MSTKKESLLASMTIVTTLLVNKFADTGQCLVYENMPLTYIRSTLFSVGYQAIWLALLASFYEAYLAVFHPVVVDIRFAISAWCVGLLCYTAEYFTITFGENALRINCLFPTRRGFIRN